MAGYVVDTHALLFYLGDSRKLGRVADAALNAPESILILPAIALAEALWIVATRRVDLSTSDLVAAIDADPRKVVTSMDRSIVEFAQTLISISEMHDRQIAATALLLSEEDDPVTLLTKDKDIVNSGAVATAW